MAKRDYYEVLGVGRNADAKRRSRKHTGNLPRNIIRI